MPPRVYVPDDPWDVQYSETAFKNGVLEGDIEHVIFLPRHRLNIFGGRASDHDVDFSGGAPSETPTEAQVRGGRRQPTRGCRIVKTDQCGY